MNEDTPFLKDFTMDYEKEYNEMVRRCRELHESGNTLTKFQMEIVCPELRESEDERIIKSIKKLLLGMREEIFLQLGVTKAYALEWLEEQKDKCKDCPSRGNTHSYLKGYEDGQTEQKPVESTDDERIRQLLVERVRTATEWNVELRDCVLAYLQRESPTYKKEALRMEYEKGRADAIAERNLDNDLFREGYEIGYEDAMRVNKPVEWSKEDNIGWGEAFACVTEAEKAAKNEEELQNAVTAENWLKEIKFKYCVHPVKQEWSEEDEKNIYFLTRLIELYIKDGRYETGDGTVTKPEIINMLKSLRPQKKWKPSEEQMEALHNATNLLAYNAKNVHPLRTLYVALKKLKEDEK